MKKSMRTVCANIPTGEDRVPLVDATLLAILRPARENPEVRTFLAEILGWKLYIHRLEQNVAENRAFTDMLEYAKVPGFRSESSPEALEVLCQGLVSEGLLRSDCLMRFVDEAVKKVIVAHRWA